MNEFKILEVKENVFKENEVNADIIRKELNEKHKLMINIMSSPGSGKTQTLVRTIHMLPNIRIGVMECDIDASVDAKTIYDAGGKSIQLHTGGMCHMDAQMTKQGLNELEIDDVDLIFIENVGNLVCPAEFDTGAHINITILSIPEGDDKPAKYPLVYQVSDLVLVNKIDALAVFDLIFIENVGNLVCPAEFDTGAHINITILSIPEGDDKPAKYPLVYQVSDLVLVNKIDALAVFDFNKELLEERIHALNKNAKIIYISAKTGEGFNEWIDWLNKKVEETKCQK